MKVEEANWMETFLVIEDTTKKDIPSLPIPCLGYRDEYTYEYDCEYEFAGEISCEYCICNAELKGKLDPRTGKRFKRSKKK